MANKWTCLLLATALLSACGRQDEGSSLDVVNGTVANGDEYAAVIQIKSVISRSSSGQVLSSAMCSASIVSDNTVLTAAHCIEDSGRLLQDIYALVPGEESNSARVEIKSLSAKMHPNYRHTGTSFDVAVIVFPQDSFANQEKLAVAPTQPGVGDEITIVGFGKSDHYNPQSGGLKRYGSNVVSKVGETVDFVGRTKPIGEGTGEQVLNSQGDSGGPMLWNNQIVGVSSSVDYKPGQVATLTGHYRNVNFPGINSFLVSTVKNFGARIDGLVLN